MESYLRLDAVQMGKLKEGMGAQQKIIYLNNSEFILIGILEDFGSFEWDKT